MRLLALLLFTLIASAGWAGSPTRTLDLYVPTVGEVGYGALVNAGFVNTDATCTCIRLTVDPSAVVGDAIYIDGSGEAQLSKADSIATARVDGFIWDLPSPGDARVILAGRVPIAGLVAGTDYYLSDVTAGALVTVAPTPPNFAVNVGRAYDDNGTPVLAMRSTISDPSTLTNDLQQAYDNGVSAAVVQIDLGGSVSLQTSTGGKNFRFVDTGELFLNAEGLNDQIHLRYQEVDRLLIGDSGPGNFVTVNGQFRFGMTSGGFIFGSDSTGALTQQPDPGGSWILNDGASGLRMRVQESDPNIEGFGSYDFEMDTGDYYSVSWSNGTKGLDLDEGDGDLNLRPFDATLGDIVAVEILPGVLSFRSTQSKTELRAPGTNPGDAIRFSDHTGTYVYGEIKNDTGGVIWKPGIGGVFAIEFPSGTIAFRVDDSTSNTVITADPGGIVVVNDANANPRIHVTVTGSSFFFDTAQAFLSASDTTGSVNLSAKTGSGGTINLSSEAGMAAFQSNGVDGDTYIQPSDSVAGSEVVLRDLNSVSALRIQDANVHFDALADLREGYALPFRSVVASGPVVLNDTVLLVDTSGGAVTLDLPTAASAIRRIFHFKKVTGPPNSMILDANGAETIDGALTQSATAQWDSIMIYSDGTAWYIL